MASVPSTSRKRQNEGAYYSPRNLSPFECRRKRRKFLDQRKLVKTGCSLLPSGPLGCGRFTQEYIDALKGSVSDGGSCSQLVVSGSTEVPEDPRPLSPTDAAEIVTQSPKTPPPSLCDGDTPPQKNCKGAQTGEAKLANLRSSVRKRLSMTDVDSNEDLDNNYAEDTGNQENVDASSLQLPLKDLVPGKSSKASGTKKKRPRTGTSPAPEDF